jgi:ribosomal protein S18 acetylase RimI-like enzyme
MGRLPDAVPATLVPFPRDLAEPLALAQEAFWATFVPGEDPAEHWPGLEARIRDGRTTGALWMREGGALGIALWSRPGPLGVALGMLYLRPAEAWPSGYRALLAAIAASVGPVVFAPSPLSGLTPAVEEEMMRGLGFAPYGRSEMVFALAGFGVTRPLPPERRVRPLRSQDLAVAARIHQKAYEGRFDRYLFLEDLDPTRDAESMVRDLVLGRWGEFLADASMVVEENGVPVGITLVLGTPRGPLIADVATDPAYAGRGVARSALEGTLGALCDRGEARVRLAVTEGNRRAITLYEKLGFVRNLGPAREWYHAGRIPVSPTSD